MLVGAMPIRTALVALLLCSTLFILRPRDSDASGVETEPGTRPPAAALVTPGDRDGSREASPLGPAALLLLAAAGFVPAFVLMARRRSRTRASTAGEAG